MTNLFRKHYHSFSCAVLSDTHVHMQALTKIYPV